MQAVKPRTERVRYRDLREWLALVEGIGELAVVEGADWNLEIGALSELNYRRKPYPALLFDRVKDYAPGFRLLDEDRFRPRTGACRSGHHDRARADRSQADHLLNIARRPS